MAEDNNNNNKHDYLLIVDGRQSLFQQRPFFYEKFKDNEDETKKVFYQEDYDAFLKNLEKEQVQVKYIFPWLKQEKKEFYEQISKEKLASDNVLLDVKKDPQSIASTIAGLGAFKNVVVLTHTPSLYQELRNSLTSSVVKVVLFSSYSQKIEKKRAEELLVDDVVAYLQQLQSVIHFNSKQEHSETYRVGYFLPIQKDLEMMKQDIFYSSRQFKYFPLDFRNTLTTNVFKIDLIIHKVQHLKKREIIPRLLPQIEKQWSGLATFCEQFKDTIAVVDSLGSYDIIADRQLLQQRLAGGPLTQLNAELKGVTLHFPQQVICGGSGSEKEAFLNELINLSFPILVKTTQAASSVLSHLMAICMTKESLKTAVLDERYQNEELVLQEFIQHSGIIHKIYAYGDKFDQQARVSIPDLVLSEVSQELQDKPWFFDSQKPFKTQLPVPVMDSVDTTNTDHSFNPESVLQTSLMLQKYLGLSLFGFDLIQRSPAQEQLEWHLIDVNYFPGFKNTKNLLQKFEELFTREIKRIRSCKK